MITCDTERCIKYLNFMWLFYIVNVRIYYIGCRYRYRVSY